MDSTENKPPEDSILCSDNNALFAAVYGDVEKLIYAQGGGINLMPFVLVWCSEECYVYISNVVEADQFCLCKNLDQVLCHSLVMQRCVDHFSMMITSYEGVWQH